MKSNIASNIEMIMNRQVATACIIAADLRVSTLFECLVGTNGKASAEASTRIKDLCRRELWAHFSKTMPMQLTRHDTCVVIYKNHDVYQLEQDLVAIADHSETMDIVNEHVSVIPVPWFECIDGPTHAHGCNVVAQLVLKLGWAVTTVVLPTVLSANTVDARCSQLSTHLVALASQLGFTHIHRSDLETIPIVSVNALLSVPADRRQYVVFDVAHFRGTCDHT